MKLRVSVSNNGAVSQQVDFTLANVSADGTRGEVTVPKVSPNGGVITGTVRVVDTTTGFQSAAAPLLQAVPILTSASLGGVPFGSGTTITLGGAGFTSAMVVRFPLAGGGTTDQPIVSGSVSLFSTSARVVIPANAVSGAIAMITSGGQSTGVTPQ